MTVQAESEISVDALAALARAVATAGAQATLHDALEAVAAASGADLAVVRVVSGNELEAAAVTGPASLAAELVGERVPASELPEGRIDLLESAPPSARRVAERAGASSILVLPLEGASLELYRSGSFSLADDLLGELTAGLVGAPVALLWQRGEDDALELVGSHGLDPESGLGNAPELAAAALSERSTIRAIESHELPDGCGVSTTL